MSMGNLLGADYQGSVPTQAQFHEFMQFKQQQDVAKEKAGLQSESEANQQASNASSGAADASKRKDKDDAPENPPAKKQCAGFIAN